MATKKAKDLRKGDKILYENQKYTVNSIEVSKIGKFGKAKCRLEVLDDKKQNKIFIVLADDNIESLK